MINFAKKSLEQTLELLTNAPKKVQRHLYELELDRINRAYLMTPEGASRDILVGQYYLIADSFEHDLNEPFVNPLHSRIQREIGDRQEIRDFRKRRIYGNG